MVEHQDCPVLYFCISNPKNLSPKCLRNALIDFAETSWTLKQVLEEQAPVSDSGNNSQWQENMASS